ncbi:MAG TPA: RNB domain-containing ribonuclease [Thermoanaerobaculia bacterium]|nr:RNB domain-containing ribonuclease [Thermoanaerobaculia bacterium]
MPSHRQLLRSLARRAMEERGMATEFPGDVQAEAARLPEEPPAPREGEASVADLTHLPWFSIDNADTRDLDQLTAAEPLAGPEGGQAGGAVRLSVAVADVVSRVAAGGAIDAHAARNTTSVYTAGKTFHMLPPRLSTELTSLVAGEERLAVVVAMTVDGEGGIDGVEFTRARVLSRAKLAYPDVAAWLEGEAEPPAALAAVPGLGEQVRLQDEVAHRLRRRRHERGALDFDSSEARPVFAGGTVVGLAVDRTNRAQKLIQDLMIAANSATAAYLEARGLPSLRRVVRAPARWDRIVELARAAGDRLPGEPDARALSDFLARRRAADRDGYVEVCLAVRKLLGGGEYTVDLPGRDAPGHFGLAVAAYTHSTAPNRRFPDLVTQRLLQAALAGRCCPYADEELLALARRCTEREDQGRRVERQVAKAAAALYLAAHVGESFDAVVAGVTGHGTWVRIVAPPVEGKLVGGGEGLDIGDAVEVRLAAADPERGFLDFTR